MFSSTTTRAKTSFTTDAISYNVCFSIVFSLSWCCPCILKYCAKQENFTQWLNNTFFLAQIPACHASRSLLPQQSGGLCTETHHLPDPVKRQTTNLQKVQRECSSASSQRFFSTWPCKLLSTYKIWIDWVWHRCRNEQHRPGLTQPALLPMMLHRQTVQKKVILLNAHTCTSTLSGLYCWRINHLPTPGCLWNQALCYRWTHRTKLMQLALLKTPINKPQSTHATHNLITSKDSKRLELFEVGLFSHKSYMRRWVKPY